MDPPASDMETSILERISCILQRPRWWVAWQKDTNFRRRWLSGHEGRWLLQGFAQTEVRVDDDEKQLYAALGAILAGHGGEADVGLKIARLERWLNGLVTELKSTSLYDWDENQGEEDEEGVEGEDGHEQGKGQDGGAGAELERLEERVARRDSYIHVMWALNQLLLHEKLRARPVHCWTRPYVLSAIQTAQRRSDASLSARCANFVLAVARDGMNVKTALRLPVSSSLRLEHEHVQMLRLHCQRLRRDVVAAQRYIERALDAIVESEGLTLGASGPTDEERLEISPAGIGGTWMSDNLLPKPLVDTFLSQVARLEQECEQQSGCRNGEPQRLELVDPSMFCCKIGETLRTCADAPSVLAAATPAEFTARLMFAGSEKVHKSHTWSPKYQWIPTDFQVSDNADKNGELHVHALSYINNLHPERHAGLTDSIAAIVGRFVPLFERVLSHEDQGQPYLDLFEVDEEGLDKEGSCNWEVPPLRPEYPETIRFPTSSKPSVSLRGSRLQIHVKLTEVVLTPENPRFPGGDWQYAGDYYGDGVVVCGVYCFSSENVQPSAGSPWMAFRSSLTDWTRGKEYDFHTPGIHGDGVSNSLDGRCFAFPSSLQHRELAFELTDPSKPGGRKMLWLMLVESENQLPSTSVIPPQQQHWVEDALRPIFKRLPLVDAAEHVMRELLHPGGLTFEDAVIRRAGLVEERSGSTIDSGRSWQPRGFLW